MEQQPIEKQEEDELVLSQLPHVKNWDGTMLYQYQGFWLSQLILPGMVRFQKHFQAQEGDVVLATSPKSGTTWLKALAFAILNRTHYSPSDHMAHPLLASNPHDLVPFLALQLYGNDLNPTAVDLRQLHGTIFATHLPYSLLAPSIVKDNSKCPIIYLCRNPLDQFISSYHFFPKVLLHLHPRDHEHGKEAIDEAFDLFCGGIQRFGPCWDHALEYWKMSRERPDKVLFLKYEDLKEDTVFYTKKMAEFLGCPFSQQEEALGVIEEIVRLCGFETMKDLDVNKTGKSLKVGFGNSLFFRKGEVGDWSNYLTSAMAERVQKLVEQKFQGSGLTFDFKRTIIDD